MKSLIFTLLCVFLAAAQAAHLTADVRMKQKLGESQYQTVERAKRLSRSKLNKSLKEFIQTKFGLALQVRELTRFVSSTKDIRFRATHSSWVGERLFVNVEYTFDENVLLSSLHAYFKTEKKKATYSKEKLRYTVEQINTYRKQIEDRRAENTASVLKVLKLNMHRKDVLGLLLYFAERNVALDIKQMSKGSDGLKTYPLKNTFLRLVFNKANMLKKIENNTPKRLQKK